MTTDMDHTAGDSAPARQVLEPEPARARARRRRRLTWVAVGGGVFVALVAFVLVYFQPQKLFLDDRVNEELPGFVATGPVAPVDAGTADDPVAPGDAVPVEEPVSDPAPAGDPLSVAARQAAATGIPVAVSAGEFVSLDHPTSGSAFLVVQPDGSRLLRIEDLDTDNGPDLRVVLNTAAVGTGDYGQLVELGGLKGNIGDQNYEIPADLDLTTIQSVVIWCERFAAPFGEAPAVMGT